MSDIKIDLAELFRRIQFIALTPNNVERKMELDFYRTVLTDLVNHIPPISYSPNIPIELDKVCPIDKAKEYLTILSELFSRIQFIALTPNNAERKMELDFYRVTLTSLVNNIPPISYSSLAYIELDNICSIDKAKEYAVSLGRHIVEGREHTYISFSKGN